MFKNTLLIQIRHKKKYNKITIITCKCGYGVKKHFEDIEKEKALAAYQQTLALKREKTNQLLKIIIPIAIVVFTIIISLIANISILAERKTFKSTDDMYNFLTSCKNWQLDSTSSNEYLVIYNYGLGQIISDNGMFNIGDEITLHPSRGTFDLQGRKYVVSKSGLRRTAEEIRLNIVYRWFLGYSLTEKTPHFSTFSYNFSHRFTEEVVQQIFNWILNEINDVAVFRIFV